MAIEKWNIDVAHSTVGFSVRHLMVSKVHGFFTQWTGSLEFDEQNPAQSKVEVSIDAASVDTREPQRDAHLRTGDFFEVEKHPRIVFTSTHVEPSSNGTYKVAGDLTLRGVTRPVILDVEFGGRINHPQMGERIGFSGKTIINRKDFGVSFNQVLDTGGLGLGEKVEIGLEIEATRAA
ncbi:YceI family protein [Pendulispora rubella]|uniref:YceI family protein n=1 Tax=Pendulispora rubella TaxID=2741070 RepID=A0ABZ2KSU3_9BACT